MMIQNAPARAAHFVSTMVEHNDLCAAFGRAFGNDRFERLEPVEQTIYVVGNHDRGWDEWDANPALDPKSGLPCGLATTPPMDAIATNWKSPDFNERHHPYCGLLSSMHSWGLYNARYGYSEFRVRRGGSPSIPINPDYAAETRKMLKDELARQERLKNELAADPGTREWVEESHLIQNYKQLQFFDTLALYFNLRHAGEHEEEVYACVPLGRDADTEVTLMPLGDCVYSLDPFPFAGDRLEVYCQGRYMKPISANEAPSDLGDYLKGLETTEQVFTFVSK